MCDGIKFALDTDSPRLITFHTPGAGDVVPIEGVEGGEGPGNGQLGLSVKTWKAVAQ